MGIDARRGDSPNNLLVGAISKPAACQVGQAARAAASHWESGASQETPRISSTIAASASTAEGPSPQDGHQRAEQENDEHIPACRHGLAQYLKTQAARDERLMRRFRQGKRPQH